MIRVKLAFEAVLAVDEPRKNFSGRLAQRLRAVADALDGRHSLAVDMHSIPALPDEVQHKCIRLGLDHAARCFNEAVINEARESAFRRYWPHLFDS